jgi:hypothetical protein
MSDASVFQVNASGLSGPTQFVVATPSDVSWSTHSHKVQSSAIKRNLKYCFLRLWQNCHRLALAIGLSECQRTLRADNGVDREPRSIIEVGEQPHASRLRAARPGVALRQFATTTGHQMIENSAIALQQSKLDDARRQVRDAVIDFDVPDEKILELRGELRNAVKELNRLERPATKKGLFEFLKFW